MAHKHRQGYSVPLMDQELKNTMQKQSSQHVVVKQRG